MYWEVRRSLGVSVIKKTMTRDRFDMIARVLHFEGLPRGEAEGEARWQVDRRHEGARQEGLRGFRG